MALHHEVTGWGQPVVFLHAGIADSGMWDPQWASFADRYRLLRCDLPGFGSSPLRGEPLRHAGSVALLLDELRVEEAAFVGCSLGGRVSLELAIARPDLVRALVLVGCGLPGHRWSDTVRAYWKAEQEAVASGDLDAATELNLRAWLDGPARTPEQVDAAIRAKVRAMQRHALELQAPYWESVDEELLVSDVATRLGEVRAPTLVVVGAEDVPDIHEVASRIAAEVPGARLSWVQGAAHLPNLEQPEAFDAIVRGFLDEVL